MPKPDTRREQRGDLHCRRLISLDTSNFKVRMPGDGEEDDGTRTITFKAGSSVPIMRQDYWGEYEEVTPFNKDGKVDLEWAASGNAPLLWQHNTDDHIGNLGGARLVPHADGHRAIEVDAVFYMDDPESAKSFRAVQMGMRRNVSIGFSVREDDWHWEEFETGATIQEGKDKGKPIMGDRLVLNNIELNEVSFVTLPADPSVGIGRSDNPSGQFNNFSEVRKMPTEIEKGSEDEQPKDQIPEEKIDRAETPKAEQPQDPAPVYDVTGQRWLARNTKFLTDRGVGEAKITELESAVDSERGLSEAEVKSRALDAVAEVDSKRAGRVETRGDAPGLIGKASKVFSTQRAMECFKKFARHGTPMDGLEAEVITDFERANAHWAPERSGNEASCFIPHAAIMADPVSRGVMLADAKPDVRERINRIYTVGTNLQGANPGGFHTEVFDENWFTEALYAASKVLPKISMMPSELAQNLIGVRESGSLSISHETQNPGSDTMESTGLSFGTRKLEWHNIRARQALAQRTLDQSDRFFAVILDRMRRYLVIEQEKVLFNGASGSNQPTGALNLSSVPTIGIATNGGDPTHETVTEMVTSLRSNNVMMMDPCFVVTPEILGKLENTPKFTGSQGFAGSSGSDTIVQNFAGMGEMIKGFPVISSNLLPKNLTKGSTSGTLHAMIFGEWSGWKMAMFSAMEMIVDPYSDIGKSNVNVYLRQAYDLVIDHVQQMAVVKDASAT